MKAIDYVVAGFGIGAAARIARIRVATGTWSDPDGEGLPLAGRTVDPSGFWVRIPGTPRALIVFRGRGSRSPEAGREIVGEPTVTVHEVGS